jgi:hypothetical protein
VEIELANLRGLIQACWNSAETETIKTIAAKHPSPDEENITFLLAGELRAAVANASKAGKVQMAFLADLRRSIHAANLDCMKWSTGLIARVSFHNRSHEGKLSAADLGVVIVRPRVHVEASGTRIEFNRDYATGLLAQAKLGREANSKSGRRKWTRLTKPQSTRYLERSDYYSLLLYRLDGKETGELQPFTWQMCKEHTLDEVRTWLRLDSFPEELSSSELLRYLFARMVGTDDPRVIDQIVDPEKSMLDSISIRIFWPDRFGPPSTVELHDEQSLQRHVQLRIR